MLYAVIVDNRQTGEYGVVNGTFYDDLETVRQLVGEINGRTGPEIVAWIKEIFPENHQCLTT